MTTDDAIELVASHMAARRPDWTLEQCLKMVEQARSSISIGPERFVNAYLRNMDIHDANRESP